MNLREQDKQILKSMGIDVFSEERQYWLIRTQGGEYYNDFRNENFVGIEWDEISDLKMINKRDEEALKSEVLHYYPKTNKPGYPVNQILKFAHNMSKGDIVLIPSENSNWISIGEILDDNMYIYEEDEEDFETLLESLDNENDEKKSILKKRRRVRWLDSVKKTDLDPYLYSVIYTHSAIANIDKYSVFIDRTLSQFYIKGDECYFTYRVNKKKNIPYSDMRKFFRANDLIIDYLDANIDDFNIDDIIFKINVQSKGPVQYKGKISSVLAMGLLITSLFGSDFKFEGFGFNFEMSTEGLPKLLKSISDMNNNPTPELQQIKEGVNKAGESLEVTTPNISTNLDNEISIDRDEIQNENNNDSISNQE